MAKLGYNEFDFIEKPFNDKFMTYNYVENRYVLTVDGANESRLDMVLIWGGEDRLNEYLDLLSRTLYATIMKSKDSKYYDKTLWLLSHSKHFRESILKIYMDTIWYNYTGGGFLLAYQSGINLNEMKQLKLSIDDALSTIGNTMTNIMGLDELILRYRISDLNVFETLDDLKVFLINKNVYTGEFLSDKNDISDIPSTIDYRIFKDLLKSNNNLCVEDLTFWEKERKLKGKEW